jgi:hypothetical protein
MALNLSTLDRRWLYLLMAVVLVVPFVARIVFPIIPSSSARAIHAAIEAVPEGGVVLVSADYDPGSEAELYPMNLAIFEQLGKRNIRVVITQLWPQAGPLVKECLEKAYLTHGKVEGVDFVNLGYKPGGAMVISKCNESIRAAFPEDVNGTPVGDLKAMEGVTSSKDIDLFVILSAGTPGIREWLEQCQSKIGKPMASGMTAVSAPDFFQYENSGQLVGLLGGLRGAADYEKLVGKPGRGVLGMGPQSFGHLLIILFIVLGNVGYLLGRRKARRAS